MNEKINITIKSEFIHNKLTHQIRFGCLQQRSESNNVLLNKNKKKFNKINLQVTQQLMT